MPNPVKYQPTEARGTALAEEVLATIEAEEAYNERHREGSLHKLDKKNAWAQNTWGEIHIEDLPAGTEIELVHGKLARRSPGLSWLGDTLAVIDSGVTCGTAMCFAGHAVTLAGDRMLFPIDSRAAEQLQAKGLRANIRRFSRKFRKEHYGGITGFGGVVASEYVLTREGKIEKIDDRARKLLNLTSGEADAMFGGSNSLHELRAFVQRMQEGRHLTTGEKTRRKR